MRGKEPPSDITGWLERLADGEDESLESVVQMCYEDLRRLAHRRLRDERTGHLLSTTGLVNEAYLRLAKQHGIDVKNRAEFFAFASECMRRVLVDYARARLAGKRGSGVDDVPIDSVESLLTDAQAREVTEIDLALDRLVGAFPRGAEVLQHRLFGGLTLGETAEVLGVSSKTVQRDWDAAIAWLRKEVGPTALTAC